MGLVDVDIEVSGDLDIKAMINRLKAADDQVTEAGVFGGFAQQKAMWNEYGTSRGIPARPFLRNTLYEQEHSWAVFLKPMFVQILNGDAAADVSGKLGPKMVQGIRKTIDSGSFAPLAPSTIRQKGSSKPLVDTGDMYGSITWKKG